MGRESTETYAHKLPTDKAVVVNGELLGSRQEVKLEETQSSSLRIEKLLTYPEVQEILRVSKETLAKLVHFRQIPVVRIGRRVRFDQRKLAEWLEAKHERPTNVP